MGGRDIGVIDGGSEDRIHEGGRVGLHGHFDKATREPHLTMFEDGGRVCTRVVSSAIKGALISTSALRGRIGTRLRGAGSIRTTTCLKGMVTRETGTGNVSRIMFSENKFVCRNGVGTLTSTTERTNLGFWKERGASRAKAC